MEKEERLTKQIKTVYTEIAKRLVDSLYSGSTRMCFTARLAAACISPRGYIVTHQPHNVKA